MLLWLGIAGAIYAQAYPLLFVPFGALLGYVVFRVVFELTVNRTIVPTLAMGFISRRKIGAVLRREYAKKNEKDAFSIIDLGSGRGELARNLAKKIPSATVKGVELARIPYFQAALAQRILGPKNLSYERGDFWRFDCSKADAIILYLAPLTVQRMGEKLRRELRPGSLVVSHTFPLLGTWTPIEVLNFRSPFKETVYVYRR